MSATRRHFLAAATAAPTAEVMGANAAVQVGWGGGLRLDWRANVFDFKNQKDVDMAAVRNRSISPA